MRGKPTRLQKKAVDNVISGKFKSLSGAMQDAGFSEKTSDSPATNLAMRKGVQEYLKTISIKARTKWNMSIEEKVMDVYMDGLSATKLFGKAAVEHPDHLARKAFADRFAEFFGWVQSAQFGSGSGNKVQQFNFFGVSEEKRGQFNMNFDKFLNRYYRQDQPGS